MNFGRNILTPVQRIIHQKAEPRKTPNASIKDYGVPAFKEDKPAKIAAKDRMVNGLAAVRPRVEK